MIHKSHRASAPDILNPNENNTYRIISYHSCSNHSFMLHVYLSVWVTCTNINSNTAFRIYWIQSAIMISISNRSEISFATVPYTPRPRDTLTPLKFKSWAKTPIKIWKWDPGTPFKFKNGTVIMLLLHCFTYCILDKCRHCIYEKLRIFLWK